MTKNPFINALAAVAYIAIVASIMYYGPQIKGPDNDNTVIVPMAIISLFTLSAAIMGFLFFYQPVLLFLDGKKKDALRLFLYTVGIFASITILILIALFFRIL